MLQSIRYIQEGYGYMSRPKMISYYQAYLQEYRQRIFYNCNCLRQHYSTYYIFELQIIQMEGRVITVNNTTRCWLVMVGRVITVNNTTRSF
jgi:hypothetical protein